LYLGLAMRCNIRFGTRAALCAAGVTAKARSGKGIGVLKELGKRLARQILAHKWRVAAAILLLLCVKAWHDTMADPIIREATVSLPGLAATAKPVRVLLMSDLHVIGPEMPPERLARIVGQANALHPDLVVIAGDFISDRALSTHTYSFKEAVAPLAALRAPLGAIAVLGNHDNYRSAARAEMELSRVGVSVLINQTVRKGPLIVGGLGDYATGHDNSPTLMRSAPLGEIPLIVVSHHPDVFAQRTFDVPLVLAGHFHCGQIGWPWGGTPAHTSDWFKRYTCGEVNQGDRTMFVTSGLGNSILPFRLFTRPDMWLITVTPRPK